MRFLILFIFIFICFQNCSNPEDCFENAGKTATKEINISGFSKILVKNGVELILKHSENTSVIIETGENLIENVSVTLENDQLVLEDLTDCNFTRDYGLVKIYVSTPTLTFINYKSEQNIYSEGVLKFPYLEIKALKEEDGLGAGNGNIYLNLDTQEVNFHSNNNANFYITGKTQKLGVYFWAGNSRFEGESLNTHDFDIFHRSTNDVIINPSGNLYGNLYGIGDLILKNNPLENTIIQNYTGKIIYP